MEWLLKDFWRDTSISNYIIKILPLTVGNTADEGFFYDLSQLINFIFIR
jgi:hypothetical protein